MQRLLPKILLVLANIGFIDAAYLTIQHYRGAVVPCSITQGCEIVLASSYSTVWSVPLALLGALYYATVVLLAARLPDNRRMLLPLAILTSMGLFASLWLVYLQFFVIHAICQYCMLSVTISVLLCAGSWYLVARYPQQHST